MSSISALLSSPVMAGAAQRVVAAGLSALFGLIVLAGGILFALAGSRWPGR